MLRPSGVYFLGCGGGREAAPVIALVSDAGLFNDSFDFCRAAVWPQRLQDCSPRTGILFSNVHPADSLGLRNAVRLLTPALECGMWATRKSARERAALSRFRKGAVLSALSLILRALPFGRTASLRLVEDVPSRNVPRRRVELLARRTRLVASVLSGRVLTFSELATSLTALGETRDHDATRIAVDSLSIAGRLEMVPGVQQTWTGRARCSRCGSQSEIQYIARCDICGRRCAMCFCCNSLGLVTSCTWLLHVPVRDRAAPVAGVGRCQARVALNIPFQLTKDQRRASRRVLEFMNDSRSREFLVWAACGSGKTEVVCAAIESVLNRGGTVLYVVPRQSAASDIHARLDHFLRGIRVGLQSGSKRIAGQDSRFLVCTAHQTLRFRHAADLVVFDEVDAYPCVPGGFLESAVRRSARRDGKIVYLTATPDSHMFERVRNRSLPFCVISARHHGRPVPVPRVLSVRAASAQLGRFGVSPIRAAGDGCPLGEIGRPARDSGAADAGMTQIGSAKQCLLRMVRGAAPQFGRAVRSFRVLELCLLCAAAADPSPALVFVPTVRLVELARDLLCGLSADCWPGVKWGFCHSKTPDSDDILRALREGRVTSVVTTTVLERGITVSGVNVTVLRADSCVFDARSLVQMAGRAGRTSECPTGSVVFSVVRTNREVETAVRMIEFMNDRLIQ